MKLKKLILTKTKAIILILLFFGSLNYTAQSGLNNMSFENWSTTVMGPAPTGWLGFNISQQTSGAQHGNKFVRIKNNAITGQGVLMLGTALPTSTVIKGGDAFTQVPVSLNGFFKTSGMTPGDVVGFTAYTSLTGTTTAVAMFSISANTASWTAFSASFMSFTSGLNDSIFIIASTGNLSGPGLQNSQTATMDVDNLSLVVPNITGIDQNSIGTSFLVYPNPASTEMNIISKNEKATSVLITDLNGKVVSELSLENETTRIDLQNYSTGVYFYSIRDEEKSVLLRSKFVVNK